MEMIYRNLGYAYKSLKNFRKSKEFLEESLKI